MTSRDFIQAEAENTDRIVLYREGLFWKAYERSAFAVCTQIRPFKPTKRSLKTLGGGELVSIGFPTRTEDRVLAGLERLSAGPERLEVRTASPIDIAQFEAWKASVPLAPSYPVRAAACAPSPAYAGTPARQECNPVTTGVSAAGRADFPSEVACRVAESIMGFDLASKTPVECMLFISGLKELLAGKP